VGAKITKELNDDGNYYNYKTAPTHPVTRPYMTRKSVRDGSFFSGSHLSLRKLILVVYCWAHDMPQTAIMHEASLESKHMVVDWCIF